MNKLMPKLLPKPNHRQCNNNSKTMQKSNNKSKKSKAKTMVMSMGNLTMKARENQTSRA